MRILSCYITSVLGRCSHITRRQSAFSTCGRLDISCIHQLRLAMGVSPAVISSAAHLVAMLFLSAGSCGYNHNQALIPSSMVARLPPDSSLIFLDCRVDESVIKFSHIGVTSCCRCKECVEPSSSSLRCECRTVSVKRAPPSPHKTTLCVTDDRLLCPS